MKLRYSDIRDAFLTKGFELVREGKGYAVGDRKFESLAKASAWLAQTVEEYALQAAIYELPAGSIDEVESIPQVEPKSEQYWDGWEKAYNAAIAKAQFTIVPEVETVEIETKKRVDFRNPALLGILVFLVIKEVFGLGVQLIVFLQRQDYSCVASVYNAAIAKVNVTINQAQIQKIIELL